MSDVTAEELMAITASRLLADHKVVFAGVGMPLLASAVARHRHAPHLTIVLEGGIIGTTLLPGKLPISTNEMRAAYGAQMLTDITDIFLYAQRGYFDYGFLGAAQVDMYGNINTSVIGTMERPKVRLPGSGGANDIISLCNEVLIVTQHEPRRFVERVDFITSPGYLSGGRQPGPGRAAHRKARRRGHRPGPARLRAGQPPDAAARAAAGRERQPGPRADRLRAAAQRRDHRARPADAGGDRHLPRAARRPGGGRSRRGPAGPSRRGGARVSARPARVGLMIPSSNTMMEVDFTRDLPPGHALHTARMYMEDTTPAGENRMLDEFALPAARDLGTARPDVVVFGCTSAGALRGNDYDTELCQRISELTHAPVVSTIGAVRTAIEASGAASIGVITPYVDELNEKIKASIEDDGIDVAGITGLGITDNFQIAEVRARRDRGIRRTRPRTAGRGRHHRPGLRLLHELRRDGRPPGHRRAAGPARGDQQPGGAGRRRRPPAGLMVAPAFEYVAAGSYDEAVRLLARKRRRGQDPGRRAEPDADAQPPARPPRTAHRHQPGRPAPAHPGNNGKCSGCPP